VIGVLRGQILRKSPQEVLIDVGGVGYRVQVPVSTFCRLGDEGASVSLQIHTHVREDQIALFGFATPSERVLFERLISVSGVGPRVALGVLSGIEADDLVRAISGNDLARLTRVPGVGRKTAERLVLELKDKLRDLAPGENVAPLAAPQKTDLVSALTNLGYNVSDAEKAADRALQATPDASIGELLRASLRLLSTR
jgi:Holliday junction DNA helicase RuvA